MDFLPLIKWVTQFLITPFPSNEGKQMLSIISIEIVLNLELAYKNKKTRQTFIYYKMYEHNL